MYFTCDLVVELPDKRCFEWVVIIRAESLTEAAEYAEKHVANWNAAARIEEMNLQCRPTQAGEAASDTNRDGIHSSFGPREIVRFEQPFKRFHSWLKGGKPAKR